MVQAVELIKNINQHRLIKEKTTLGGFEEQECVVSQLRRLDIWGHRMGNAGFSEVSLLCPQPSPHCLFPRSSLCSHRPSA